MSAPTMLRKIARLPLPLRSLVCSGLVLAFVGLVFLWPPLVLVALGLTVLAVISFLLALAMGDLFND